MSTFYSYELTCPLCGRGFTVELLEGLHATRLPFIRQEILDGRYQVFDCPGCAEALAVTAPVVYTDFTRHEYVAMETGAAADWHDAQLKVADVFNRAFLYGPPIAQEMGRGFTRRLVFGTLALREKLMLWEAGLDDRAVEAVKGEHLEALDLDPGDALLRLERVLPGGHLLFGVYEPGPQPGAMPGNVRISPTPRPVDFETVIAPVYQRWASSAREIERRFPWLSEEWYVDLHGGPWYLHRG